MALSEEQAFSVFMQSGALLQGHFLLTSGRHSARYFQCAKVLQYPWHTTGLCATLAQGFAAAGIQTVIAPAMGGIIVGQEVARQLNARFIFAERETKNLELRRGFSVAAGERCLVCEDVVTTGGSVFEVIDIIKNAGGIVAGVACLVDRSNGAVQFPVPSLSVIKLQVESFAPEQCPMCAAGSLPVKPGSRKQA